MKSMQINIEDEIDSGLSELAAREAKSKEELVREALIDFLRRRKKETICQEMRLYAEEMADGSADFAAETDASVDEHLLRKTQW
ncbi:MAG: ribbon-helix-helix protein, CopG family [Planctomycetota bacterium]|nr:ribbon-helix-helix protein, CopG family [Planctomycetota bacterium]